MKIPCNKRNILLIYAALVLLTLFAFAQVRNNNCLDYDDGYVYENPNIIKGITFEPLTRAFRTTNMSNWHPLTRLSHMLDCKLSELDASGFIIKAGQTYLEKSE